jgi:hypothetical protein
MHFNHILRYHYLLGEKPAQRSEARNGPHICDLIRFDRLLMAELMAGNPKLQWSFLYSLLCRFQPDLANRMLASIRVEGFSN